MRKIFLDCGGNLGRAVAAFLRHYPDSAEYEIYSFEPQTRLNKFYEGLPSNVKLLNMAVWIWDGDARFYYTENVKGSTLFADKSTTPIISRSVVPCIDLSRWMSQVFDPDDYIVLKMNIEGAEISILQKMLRDKTIEMVNELYVSLHAAKIESMDAEQEKSLQRDLKKRGITHSWPPPWGHVRPKQYPFDEIGAPDE